MQQQEQQENYYQKKFKWTQFNKIYCIPEYSSSSISSHRWTMRRPTKQRFSSGIFRRWTAPVYLTLGGKEDEKTW